MKNVVITRRELGDVVRDMIHTVVDATPLPAATKSRIKGCAGCSGRVKVLNAVSRTVRRLTPNRITAPKVDD